MDANMFRVISWIFAIGALITGPFLFTGDKDITLVLYFFLSLFVAFRGLFWIMEKNPNNIKLWLEPDLVKIENFSIVVLKTSLVVGFIAFVLSILKEFSLIEFSASYVLLFNILLMTIFMLSILYLDITFSKIKSLKESRFLTR